MYTKLPFKIAKLYFLIIIALLKFAWKWKLNSINVKEIQYLPNTIYYLLLLFYSINCIKTKKSYKIMLASLLCDFSVIKALKSKPGKPRSNPWSPHATCLPHFWLFRTQQFSNSCICFCFYVCVKTQLLSSEIELHPTACLSLAPFLIEQSKIWGTSYNKPSFPLNSHT